MNTLPEVQEQNERMLIDIDITQVNHAQEARKLVDPYLQGSCYPEAMWAKIHHLKTILEEAEKMVKDHIVDDLSKSGNESFNIAGLKIRVKKGAGRWSYPGNSTIENYKSKIKEVEELAKIASRSKEPVIYGDEVIPPAIYVENKDTLEVKIL